MKKPMVHNDQLLNAGPLNLTLSPIVFLKYLFNEKYCAQHQVYCLVWKHLSNSIEYSSTRVNSSLKLVSFNFSKFYTVPVNFFDFSRRWKYKIPILHWNQSIASQLDLNETRFFVDKRPKPTTLAELSEDLHTCRFPALSIEYSPCPSRVTLHSARTVHFSCRFSNDSRMPISLLGPDTETFLTFPSSTQIRHS